MARSRLLILAAGLLVAIVAVKAHAGGSDLKKLVGSWVLLHGGKHDGTVVTEEEAKKLNHTMVIVGNVHTVKAFGKTFKGTHTLDETKTPKTVDFVHTEGPLKGKTFLGIYELKGDDLRICLARPGEPRPTDLSHKKGSGHEFHHWKRAKN